MKFYRIRDSVMFNNGKIVLFDCGLYAYLQDSNRRVIIGRGQKKEASFSEVKPFSLDVLVREGKNFTGTIPEALIYFVFNYNPKTDMENFWRMP